MIKGATVGISGLSVSLNGVRLLASMDLHISAGQWCGIAGRNGGGKSTLLKSIAGLLPHKGQISLDWHNGQRRLGYMPQVAPFDTSLPISVQDFLRFSSQTKPVWLGGRKSAQLDAIAQQVGIQGLLIKRLGTLSMGERQRVLLANALLQKPDLLLLDEPLAGLDSQGQEHILALLADFHQAGGTLLMVEHNWQVLEQYCDQIVTIEGGLKSIQPGARHRHTETRVSA